MGRIRTIKPDFFTSLTIADLSVEQRLTFIGLWTHVDDAGRCVDDPRLIKAALWPLDDRSSEDIESDLRALTEASLIARYTVTGRRFIVVQTWSEHQRINRPTASKLPGPNDGDLNLASPEIPTDMSAQPLLTEEAVTPHRGKGREGNRERKGTGSTTSSTGSAVGPSTPDSFPDFWAVYPRREAKRKAEQAYRTALRRASSGQILVGARRYRDDPNREQSFTALPATWLNGDRWGDDPLPTRGGRSQDAAGDMLQSQLAAARARDEAADTLRISA